MFSQRGSVLSEGMGSDCRAPGDQQASKRAAAPILFGLLLALTLSGCGGSGGADSVVTSAVPPVSAPPPSAPPPVVLPPTANSIHGRFVGAITIDGVDYFGDAIVTSDGATRLYIGGPGGTSSAGLQVTKPASSAQFVGHVDWRSGFTSGTGAVIGQGCSAPVHSRFCAKSAPGAITLTADAGVVRGEMRVTTDAGIESWRLHLTAWDNFYTWHAGLESVVGQYKEELAEFASEGDVTMTVDGAGRVFFQSPNSACIGNGTLAPQREGTFNVYDVALTIESCSGPYAYLNGVYEGLSTTSPSGYWDYDVSLRTWLSKRAGDASPPAALIMWGQLL